MIQPLLIFSRAQALVLRYHQQDDSTQGRTGRSRLECLNSCTSIQLPSMRSTSVLLRAIRYQDPVAQSSWIRHTLQSTYASNIPARTVVTRISSTKWSFNPFVIFCGTIEALKERETYLDGKRLSCRKSSMSCKRSKTIRLLWQSKTIQITKAGGDREESLETECTVELMEGWLW